MTSPEPQVDEMFVLICFAVFLVYVLAAKAWQWLREKPEPPADNLAQFPPRWDESLSDVYDGPSDRGTR